ncbi:SMP-30/gluconolactonase/LRE family protein [Yinghuangia soli]|uniref:Superoxide dismutase n=1 Tax=Yinghuangia soli TaxID=2908204 RepID=A0AA41U6W6_9ACTN|nr:superoxide dismutase [Yinghuangia soli]MCF2533447.1 superoxide dismutase [Yinghuangia soli]
MRSSRAFARAAAVTAAVASLAASGVPVASAAEPPSAAAASAHRPQVWAIPGAQAAPEGIARDPYRPYFYTGSAADGTVYRGDLRSGAVEVFLPGGADGRTGALGMKVDARGRLIIAGGFTGLVWVYDTRSGTLLHTFSSGTGSLLNDVAVAANGDVYVTDTLQPKIYRITADRLAAPAAPAAAPLPVFADFTGSPVVDGTNVHFNGIVVTPDQRYLIAAHMDSRALLRIDRRTSEIRRIDLGGADVNGDGLLIRGRTLYAVSSIDGTRDTVNIVHLGGSYAAGMVERRATHALLDRPSTAAFDGDAILAVNFQWDVASPNLPYTVVRVPLSQLT